MPNETYVARFRRAVGDPGGATPVFEDEEIDDFFAQADEDYSGASENAKLAFAIIKGLESLQIQYATQVNYTANSASEGLGKVFDNYEKLIKAWTDKFNTELMTTTPMAMWGSTSRTPLRDKEYPDA